MSNNIPLAVMFMMLSVATYAIQDVIVKLLPPEITVIQICFFRAVFSFIPIGIMCMFEKERRFFRTASPGLHFWRALASTLSLLCFVGAFRLIPLTDAYAITFSCPLFMTLMAIPMLKEKVSLQRWTAVVLGFVGVLIVMRPGHTAVQFGGIVALFGGFFYAISLVLVRRLSDRDNNSMIVLTFNCMSIIVCAVLLPFNWVPLDLALLPKFAVIGILGGSAQYAMTHAIRTAPVSAIAPFDYVALIWGTVFGYAIWHDIPDVYVIFGSILIVGAGIYIIRHEKKLLFAS